MGRSCHVCGRQRPNEQFGGRGRRSRVCQRCRSRGRSWCEAQLTRDWISGLPKQKNISEGSLANLRRLLASEDPTLRREARFALRIAEIAPQRRGRYRRLVERAPELIKAAAEHDWIHPEAWWWYQEETLDPVIVDADQEELFIDLPDPVPPATGFRDHEEEFWFWWEYVRDA